MQKDDTIKPIMAKDKQLQIRVSDDMHRIISEAAAQRGFSVTTLVMLALRDYVPELSNNRPPKPQAIIRDGKLYLQTQQKKK